MELAGAVIGLIGFRLTCGECGTGVVGSSGFLQKIVISSDVGRNLTRVDVENLGREMPDKVNIMRDRKSVV